MRAASQADAAAIAAIYAPYVLNTAVSFEVEPPTAEMMARRILCVLGTHPWLVAELAGELVGYAYAGKHAERSAYRWTVDTTVYIHAAVHRRGIGSALYGALLAAFRGQGFRSAFAEIVLPNPGSVRLHELAGFRPIDIHNDVSCKLGSWHDIGYWRLRLSAADEPPFEPIPFAAFRKTPAFSAALR